MSTTSKQANKKKISATYIHDDTDTQTHILI